MIILTKHCKEQIRKRAFNKKNVDNYKIWNFALSFIKNTTRIEDEKFVYFTDKKYTLVCSKKHPKTHSPQEAKKIVESLSLNDFIVYYNTDLIKVSKNKLLEILDSTNTVVVVSKFGDVFIGKPLVAITFRPAKINERFNLFGKLVKRKVNCDKEAIGLLTYPFVIFTVDKKYNALCLPGGTKEENETDLETIKRELREELNLEVKKISDEFIETIVYSPKRKTYVKVKTYIGTVEGNLKIKEDEIKSVLIFNYSEIDEKLLQWLNQRFLLGPSVVDTFLIKRKKLEEIIKRVLK